MEMSRGQEREERRNMGRGLRLSMFGLLFSWVPALGVILAATGFIKIFSCITKSYRVRRFFYMLMSFILLAAATGVLMYGVYLYVDNPNIIRETGMWVFQKLTGQEELPTADEGIKNYYGGVDYTDSENPGLGQEAGGWVRDSLDNLGGGEDDYPKDQLPEDDDYPGDQFPEDDDYMNYGDEDWTETGDQR